MTNKKNNKSNKNNKPKSVKKDKKIAEVQNQLQMLQDNRTGGRIALTGFSFQLFYSCYEILLNEEDDTIFILEGIEDIDKIEINKSTYIQLKHSKNKESANFMDDIFKNFLELYLLNDKATFKLVYDFDVATGNLSKLINGTLDEKSKKYWKEKIINIKNKKKEWNWENFNFEDFIDKISFEKIDYEDICIKIENLLVEQYNISTGNEILFANALKIFCLEKMRIGGEVRKLDLINLITKVNNDIKRGFINPATNWIKKVDFEVDKDYSPENYYEGKKASPQDIANEIPIVREKLEFDIKELVKLNNVSVIKASSGQGKSTLLYRVAYELKDEYSIYQLNWCNESKEVDNIVKYFKERVECGEKIIILIDNLGINHKEWNYFAERLQEEVKYHYKIIITTREDDWYYYSGDLSNIYKLNIININLNENEAEQIFLMLKKSNRLHETVKEWRKYWEMVSAKKLLIEYIFLLTHGEMLRDRITQQIKNINASQYGGAKCELLRKICFADICDVSINIKKLVKSLSVNGYDIGELLRSIENEFFIKIDQDNTHISGLHPVRSKHIVDQLHEYYPIEDTAFDIIKLTDENEFEKLFFYLETFITEGKTDLYKDTVEYLIDNEDLHKMFLAIRGVFARNIKDYYIDNKDYFDEADEVGGLFLLVTDTSPFTKFKQFDYEFSVIDDMSKITNIDALKTIKNNIKKINLCELSIYCLCKEIDTQLCKCPKEIIIKELDYFVKIAYWLYNIDDNFNLADNEILIEAWSKREVYPLETITGLLHINFALDNETYIKFTQNRLSEILDYIKVTSNSTKLFIDEKNKIIYVEYIYIRSASKNANDESVDRLNAICKALPIFEEYGADAIKSNIEVFQYLETHNDAHKKIPLKNLNMSFNSEFNAIHMRAIMSNYDCETVYEWLSHWMKMRQEILILCENTIKIMAMILSDKKHNKAYNTLACEVDKSRNIINKGLIKSVGYPKENSEFKEKNDVPEEFKKTARKYFNSIGNFVNMYVGIIEKDMDKSRLGLINLLDANSNLLNMQLFFSKIINEHKIFEIENDVICSEENKQLFELLKTLKYYNNHTSSQYFQIRDITTDYENEIKRGLNEASDIICENNKFNDIVIPNKYYIEGISKYYPLIIPDEFDITDEIFIYNFIEMLQPFKDTEIDYIVFSNVLEDNLINNYGLRISKHFLTQISQRDIDLVDNVWYPKPIEIGREFLECFANKFEVRSSKIKDVSNDTIVYILEHLWAYSRYTKELVDEKDIEYLNNVHKDIKNKIDIQLNELKNNNLTEGYNKMNILCQEVYNGLEFNDDLLNIEINKLIYESIENN